MAAQVDIPVHAMVRHCGEVVRERLAARANCCGIVLGCGRGDEVAYLRRALGSTRIVGLDKEPRFSPAARADRCVLVADAEQLPFPDESLDFAAAFHSLEHVSHPGRMIDELWRALRPGGWFYLGVPNRSRLIGYLGSFEATRWQKISWNVQDYAARLRGRFHNESGAHAGFTRQEILSLLEGRFCSVELLTEQFLRFKYAGRLAGLALDLLLAPRLIDYSAPAHYAICQKSLH